jgi:CDP-diacylglycerol--glycerol-3-phosphate 3-phosphatidyltransferase
LARELLVTSLRGSSEDSGQDFGAAWSGKLKMGLQSFTILAILIYVNYLHWLQSLAYDDWAGHIRDFFIWATIAVTIMSGLLYVRRAVILYQRHR